MTEMQRVGDLLGNEVFARILSERKISPDALSSDPVKRNKVVLDLDRARADRYNASCGTLDDGINCAKCLNRGDFARVDVLSDGTTHEWRERCTCMAARESVQRMRASGMERTIKLLRFDSYDAQEPWQEGLLKGARAYASDRETTGWLYMGGAVGSGKTHLCTAVCREMLAAHKAVYYCPWTDDVVRLKQTQYDEGDEYNRLMVRLKSITVLYIDDLFKPLPGTERPSDADIRLAYEIINHRYINRLRTIVSCERYSEELLSIDEATGSRIIEMAWGHTYDIARGRERNHRLKGGTMI